MFDKINSDCSIRVNGSWTFEIPKSVAAMAATAATVPTPLDGRTSILVSTITLITLLMDDYEFRGFFSHNHNNCRNSYASSM